MIFFFIKTPLFANKMAKSGVFTEGYFKRIKKIKISISSKIIVNEFFKMYICKKKKQILIVKQLFSNTSNSI